MPPRNVAWRRSGSLSVASPPLGCWARRVAGSRVTAASAAAKTVASFDGFIESVLLVAGARSAVRVLVIFHAEVRDLLLAHHPPQRVLEFGVLNEEVVLGIQARPGLRALEVEGQPFLGSRQPGAARQVEEQRQIEHDRRRENRVAVEESDLDLHL